MHVAVISLALKCLNVHEYILSTIHIRRVTSVNCIRLIGDESVWENIMRPNIKKQLFQNVYPQTGVHDSPVMMALTSGYIVVGVNKQ